jgi:16S rRNA (guanine(1405)-N(7))-methyltransferase
MRRADGVTSEQLADAALSSKMRSHISRELAIKLSEQELAKGRSTKEALKALKNRLHQVVLSYESDATKFGELSIAIGEAAMVGPVALRNAALASMRAHSSTNERLAIMEELYKRLMARIPTARIIDLACGLNPLSIPWMPLQEGFEYTAVDASAGCGQVVESFFRAAGITGSFLQMDLASSIPAGSFDTALLMKAVPCFDQIEEGLGMKIAAAIDAKYLIISYPTRSLGGKSKGMEGFYKERFKASMAILGWSFEEIVMPGELAYIVRK